MGWTNTKIAYLCLSIFLGGPMAAIQPVWATLLVLDPCLGPGPCLGFNGWSWFWSWFWLVLVLALRPVLVLVLVLVPVPGLGPGPSPHPAPGPGLDPGLAPGRPRPGHPGAPRSSCHLRPESQAMQSRCQEPPCCL